VGTIYTAYAANLSVPDTRLQVVGGANSQVVTSDASDATYVQPQIPGTTRDFMFGGVCAADGSGADEFLQKARFYIRAICDGVSRSRVRVEIAYSDKRNSVTGANTFGQYRIVQTMLLFGSVGNLTDFWSDWGYYFQDISIPTARGMPMPTTTLQLSYKVSVNLVQGDGGIGNVQIFRCGVQVYAPKTPLVLPGFSDSTPTFNAGIPTFKIERTVPFEAAVAQLKVFDANIVADASFDQDTSPAIWDSGIVQTPADENQTTTWLWPDPTQAVWPLGRIMVYARMGTWVRLPSAPYRWAQWTPIAAAAYPSAWGSPRAPKITVTDQLTASRRISLTVVGQDNLLSSLLTDSPVPSVQTFNGSWKDPSGVVTISRPVDPSLTLSFQNQTSQLWWSIKRGTTGTASMQAMDTTDPSTKNTIPVTAARVYACCCWAIMKAGSTSRTMRFEVDWYNAAGTLISTTTTSTTTVPVAFSAPVLCTQTVTAPALSVTANFRLAGLAMTSADEMCFQGITFRPYDNADGNTPSAGGFGPGNKLSLAGDVTAIEGGGSVAAALTHNMISGGFVTTVGGHSGTGAWLYSVVDLTNESAWVQWPDQWSIEGGFTIDPRRAQANSLGAFLPCTLSASIWLRAATTSGREARVGIVWQDVTGKELQVNWGAKINPTTGGWIQAKCENATGPKEAVYASLRVAFDATPASEGFYFDDMSLCASTTAVDPFMIGWREIDTDRPDSHQTFWQFQRQDGAGTAWKDIPYLQGQYDWKQASPATIYDYAAPYGVQVSYRARTISAVGVGIIRYGDWSPVVSVTTSTTAVGGRWHLVDPITPANNLDIDLTGEKGWPWTRVEDQAVFEPVARSTPIILADVVRSKTFDFSVDFLVPAEFNLFMALANAQRTLLLRRPWTGEQWWIRIGPKVEVIEQSTTPIRYIVDATAREVDVPTVN
jgi:hypothetical protein